MEAPATAMGRNRRALLLTFGISLAYLLVEVAGGLWTNSLALLADAAHMFTDVSGLALALFASWIAQRPATPAKTYGYYRMEILAALVNAVLLFLMAFFILYEAYQRWQEPEPVASGVMLAIAVCGLGVNLLGMWFLHRGAGESLNIRAAYLEVLTDALGSVATIVAALVMLTTGWYHADPLFSALIGLVILPRTWALMNQAVHVLLEGTPAHISIPAVEQALLDTEGVASVHDLHVWSLTSGLDCLSVHLVAVPGTTPEAALALVGTVNEKLKRQFNLTHCTIQVELATACEQREGMTAYDSQRRH
jgi:cobalt-zinc-cadmium efflux system protein